MMQFAVKEFPVLFTSEVKAYDAEQLHFMIRFLVDTADHRQRCMPVLFLAKDQTFLKLQEQGAFLQAFNFNKMDRYRLPKQPNVIPAWPRQSYSADVPKPFGGVTPFQYILLCRMWIYMVSHYWSCWLRRAKTVGLNYYFTSFRCDDRNWIRLIQFLHRQETIEPLTLDYCGFKYNLETVKRVKSEVVWAWEDESASSFVLGRREKMQPPFCLQPQSCNNRVRVTSVKNGRQHFHLLDSQLISCSQSNPVLTSLVESEGSFIPLRPSGAQVNGVSIIFQGCTAVASRRKSQGRPGSWLRGSSMSRYRGGACRPCQCPVSRLLQCRQTSLQGKRRMFPVVRPGREDEQRGTALFRSRFRTRACLALWPLQLGC